MKKQELDTIDFKAIFNRFFQHWPLFVLSIIVSLSVAYIYIRYTEPVYRIITTLLVKPDDKASSFEELDFFRQDKKMGNEIARIRSYDMALMTLEQLDFDVSYFHKGQVRDVELYNSPPFKVIIDTFFHQQLYNVPVHINVISAEQFRLSIGEGVELKQDFYFDRPVKLNDFSFTILRNHDTPAAPNNQCYFIIYNRSLLANYYRNKVGVVTTGKESTILEISTTGSIVQKELTYLNKLMEVYIQSRLDEKNKIATNTIKFIDDQLSGIVATLSSTESELENFRKTNKVMDLGFAANTVFQKLSELESDKAVLLVNAKYYDYILKYINSNRDLNELVVPSSMGIQDPILNSLILQLTQLNQDKASISGNSNINNPYVNTIELKIKNLKESLIENINNIINSSNISIKDINERILRLEAQISSLPRTERKMVDIQRRFTLNDHIYNYLLEKRAESGIAKASNLPDHKVIEEARTINALKVAPKNNLIYSSALILGLVIPLFLLFLKSFLNNKIISKEDIEKQTDIPIIGIIGHSENASNLVVIKNPKSSIAEAFRAIRINLQYLAPDKLQKTICITSSISGEGKTFFSINMASIMALSGKKTLLIGADLRKPRIYADLNISNTHGLSTFLSNQTPLDKVVNKTDIQNLYFISSGPIPPNPAELISSQRMDDVMAQLKQEYDVIVIDTPPIGLVADGIVLMKYSDINLYIVRHKYTEIKLLDKVNNYYEQGRIKNLSIAINDLITKDAKYGYGYEYGYGYYSGQGYYDDQEKKSLWPKWLKYKFRK